MSARLVVLVSLALLATLAAEPAVAGDRRHKHRFHADKVYRGSFPDPDVFRLGHLFVATGTTVARRSLPMLTSKDARTWRARHAHGHGRHRTNDAMVGAPRWAYRKKAGGRQFVPSWAPSIGRAANGRWLAAYAAPLRHHPRKRCVGIASSRHPLGPYRHFRKHPLVCARGENVIDPDLFRSHGRTYLLWKTEGTRRTPATIWSRPLQRNGHGFKPGSHKHRLLRTGRAWEGPVIENPSMIRFRGRLYLFYSGNRWYTRRYAVGYAVCRSVAGPCRRISHRPLLTSGRGIAGPGGQSAFRDRHGRLLLAYAAWPARRVGSERRLHVARLKVKHHGRLVVATRILRKKACHRPGGGTVSATSRPTARTNRAIPGEARPASAATVSDGLTVSEVGTALASVTFSPEWPRSWWSAAASAEVAGSSPGGQDSSGWAERTG